MQRLGDRPADASGGTGDKRALAGQIEHEALLLLCVTGLKRRGGSFELLWRAHGARLETFEPACKSGEHAAGANLIKTIDALVAQIEHRLTPPHHAGHLLDETGADGLWVADGGGEHIGDERHRRGRDLHLAQSLLHDLGSWLHQRAMKGSTYGK